MDIDNINDVLSLSSILDAHGAGRSANLIAALLDWRDGGGGNIAPAPPAPAVLQQDHSAAEDAVARVEAEPPAPPAKKAPAKAAKGRAKPPPTPADDDTDADF